MLRFVVLAVFVTVAPAVPYHKNLEQHWKNFKTVFNKNYNEKEESVRRLIFEQNVAHIVQHNLEADLEMHTYRLGLNAYADLTSEEFVKQMNGYRRSNQTTFKNVFIPPRNVMIPDKVDWRDKNVVTGVKDQKQCGSCWAFSTTGSVEGQHALKTGKLVSLSEQNLVDCSGKEGNMGCNGGLMDYGFQYIIDNKGIDREDCYKYKAIDEKCKFKPDCIGATITGYKDIPSGDEQSLKNAVATVGPISVAIDAGHISFQLYSGGIYNEPSCSSSLLDHGVLAVGYGTDNGKDYWLVKNSWGKSWGDKGYIKMTRNKNNQCGIATQASYPTV
ncbi:cathepsin L-like peptidase [Tachypleus tridentatus]|uniref:cathepsin L-like peptidase n=1 Tax=Tachypleus tridentatus TaxID=6853 RepID=UPI003FCFB31C